MTINMKNIWLPVILSEGNTLYIILRIVIWLLSLHHKIRKYFHQNEIDLYFTLVDRPWADFKMQKSQQFNNWNFVHIACVLFSHIIVQSAHLSQQRRWFKCVLIHIMTIMVQRFLKIGMQNIFVKLCYSICSSFIERLFRCLHCF